MKIYETPNPSFLNDIFVFAEVEEIGLCYIKVNCFNRIEEIGFGIQRRMCRPIEDIMQYAKKAAKIRRHIFNSIDIEYWGKIRNQWIYGGFPPHAFTETSEEGFQCEIVGNIHDNPELLKTK